MENNRRNCGRRYLDNNRSAMILAYGVIAALSIITGFILGKIF